MVASLVVLSALFSGLTLGLMTFDKNALEVRRIVRCPRCRQAHRRLCTPHAPQIVMKGGTELERRYAKVIKPVRDNGNLLLCTLLMVMAVLLFLLCGTHELI